MRTYDYKKVSETSSTVTFYLKHRVGNDKYRYESITYSLNEVGGISKELSSGAIDESTYEYANFPELTGTIS